MSTTDGGAEREPPPVAELLIGEWAAVAALAAGFDEADWAAPTSCPGWDVKDHLSHLVGTESWLSGAPVPPGPPGRADHVRNALGDANEAWVAARRERSGPEVLAEFEAVTTTRATALRSMTAEEWSRPTDSPVGSVPYAVFMEVRLMDCFVHEQDLRDATGRPPRYDGPEAAASVGRLTGVLGLVVGKRCAAPEGTSVLVELTGDAGCSVAVRVAGGRARPVDPPAQPTVRIALPAPAYVRLAAGRTTAADALAGGQVDLDGDRDLALAVLGQLGHMP